MRRRRRHSRAWIPLLFLVLVAIAAAVLLRYVFVVRNVELSGNQSASNEAVIRAARIGLGASIFNVDEEKMREGVNALGTIKLDSVEVRYPDTVVLRVSERRRDAMLLHMGEIRLLDEECCLVESAESVPNTDLIYVNGMTVTNMTPGFPLQAREGQVEAFCAVMQAINANSANAYVSEIELSDVSNLRLITRTGITVELGDMQNMQNKIAWMKSAVSDLDQRGEGGGTLDVRSGNKADYSRSGGQAAEQEVLEYGPIE